MTDEVYLSPNSYIQHWLQIIFVSAVWRLRKSKWLGLRSEQNRYQDNLSSWWNYVLTADINLSAVYFTISLHFHFQGLIIKVKKRNCLATDIKNTWKSCACGLFVCLFFYYPLNECMHHKHFACVKMKLKLSRTEQ